MAKKHGKEQDLDFFYMNHKEEKKKGKRAMEHRPKKREKNKNQQDKEDKFNFDDEIVIGVNVNPEFKKREPSKAIQKKRKKEKQKRVNEQNENKDRINLDNEIIIGVDVLPNHNEDKSKKKKQVNSKNKVNNKKENRKKGQKNLKNPKTVQEKVKKETEQEREKRIKRNRRIKSVLKLLLLLFVFSGIAVFLMTSPMFNITEIEVNGNSKITKEQIVSLSNIQLNENIYRLSKKKVEEAVKQNAYVQNVTIKRKIPNKVQIDVTERTPEYILLFGNAYVYIDKQGYILEISDVKLELPILTGYQTKEENLVPGERLQEEDLEKLNTVLKIVESSKNYNLYSVITQINIANKNDYVLVLESKQVTVYLGDAENINDRMLVLQKMLETENGNAGEAFLKDKERMFFRRKTE